MSATARLIDFAAADHTLPDAVRAASVRLIADTLTVGAAGGSGPGYSGVLTTAQSWGEGAACRLLADSRARLPANAAAYVNSFAVHCLEWDAVHEGAVVHAMSAVVPAVMAACDRRGGGEPDAVLAAIAVGVDVAAGLGLAANGPLRFFRPAITGIYGAALAVARLEGVDPARFADVLGLAHAHAAGTMQAHSEGSIALPLQFANAARGALHAVDLVRNGLSGPHEPLEGPFGHFALFEEGELSAYTETIGERWRIAELSVKPFPSGRASHAMLGALAEAGSEDVAAIEAHVPPLIRHLVARPMRRDMTPAYARLCLPFLMALMRRDGAIDPRRFTADTFTDGQLADFAARVTIHDDGNPDPNAMAPQKLVLIAEDGTRREIAIPATLGSPEHPLDERQATAKVDLARALAPAAHDPRIFTDPLAYLVDAA